MENLFLVEGKNDLHVVKHILLQHSLANFQKKTRNGEQLFFQNLPLNIEATAEQGNMVEQFGTRLDQGSTLLNAIGLMLDFDDQSDEHANKHDEAVRNEIIRLQKKRHRWKLDENFTILSDTNEGFIAEPANKDTPRIGVWLMPDNHNRGMLETFLQRLIPEERSKLLEHARHSTDKAKGEHAAPFKPVHREKAVVHTFLAWMDEPGYPFGTSFQNGSFDAKSALANKFVEWMQKLFRD